MLNETIAVVTDIGLALVVLKSQVYGIDVKTKKMLLCYVIHHLSLVVCVLNSAFYTKLLHF